MASRLDPGMCEAGYAPSLFVNVLFDYCETRGVDPCMLFAEPRASARDPFAPYPRERLRQLLLTGAAHFGDGSFPISVGASMLPKHLGLLGFAIRAAKSVREAFAVLLRHYHLITQGDALHLQVDAATFTLHWEWKNRPQPILEELIVAGVVQIARIITARRNLVSQIEFRGPPPDDLVGYETFFGGELRFGRPRSAVVAGSDTLGHSISTADPELLVALENELSKKVGQHQPQTAAQAVHRAIAQLAHLGLPTAHGVAEKLKVPLPDLLQRLQSEGRVFRDVRDAALRELAERYLRDQQLSLQAVAERVGYSDHAAFTIAFRRWSGVSPRTWRRSALWR